MKLTNNLYYYPENGPFDSNTYVISGNPSILVDPGNSAFLPQLVASLRQDGIDIKDIGVIVNTHLHGDHCYANEEVRRQYGARIGVHPVQKENYNQVVIQGARYLGIPPIESKEDFILEDGSLSDGDMEVEMICAPGHSPDSVCYYLKADKALICGDVIFHNNVGRVDIPGGSAEELAKSIARLSEIEAEFLLPGHMGIVTGKANVAENFRFVREGVLRWI